MNGLQQNPQSKTISPQWNETPPVGKFYANLANDIKNHDITVNNGIAKSKTQEIAKKYSEFSAIDMNKFAQSKMQNNQSSSLFNIPNVGNTNFKTSPKQEPNDMKPTISSRNKQTAKYNGR